MGEMIYARVDSRSLQELNYVLLGVTIRNAKRPRQKFDIIGPNGEPNQTVRARTSYLAETGKSINFEYLSFGFENNSNQNDVTIECRVLLYIVDNDEHTTIRPTTTETTSETTSTTTYSTTTSTTTSYMSLSPFYS